MNRTTRVRLLAAGASTLLSLLAAWAAWHWLDREPEGLVFFEPDLESLAAERAPRPPAAGPTPRSGEAGSARVHPPLPVAEERRYFLSEEHVERLYGVGRLPRDNRIYDPWVAYVSRPGRNRESEWDEHPDGVWYSRTNEEGLADRPFDRALPRDFKVVAAGDSHTFGICNVEENWANQLEALLTARWPGRTVEVLNTGQGGYSFYNYIGALEKYLVWEPDAFVLAIYAGNDFSELLGPAAIFGETEQPLRLSKEESDRRRHASEEISQYASGQCFNNLIAFQAHPEWIGPALELSLGLVAQMQEICAAWDMLFVVAVIPAPCDLQWPEPIAAFRAEQDYLQIPDEGLGVTDRMVDRLLDGLRELGIPSVDLRPRFEAQPEPPYWRRDLHLDVDGHRLLAEEVLPLVAEWAEASGRL